MLLLLSLIFFITLGFLYSFFVYSFFFFPISLVLPFFLLIPLPLCTFMAFYTICRDRICHFYLLTTFSMWWVSFQDCLLVCRLDVANQLLLPILGDMDQGNIEFSVEEEVVEVELRKGMSGNAKLSNWVGAFSKTSDAVCRAAFITFWLCKFIFGSHLHYAVKPLYFCRSEFAVGPSISGSFVCAVGHSIRWWEAGEFLPHSYYFCPQYHIATSVVGALCHAFG